MEKIAIYARVSTSEGKQDYQRQIDDLTRVILLSGYTNDQIDIFAEKVSGFKKNDDRPEMSKLLKLIEENHNVYKCIYVTEVSRIGRNPSETRRIIDWLTDIKVPAYIHSITSYTLDANGERPLATSILLQALMEFANLEAKTFKERTTSGKLQKASLGRNVGSNLAYGYYSGEDKMITIEPDESLVVEQIFKMYSEGTGSDAIANILNQMKIPTRYNITHGDKEIKMIGVDLKRSGSTFEWKGETIRKLIKNPIYIGKRLYKGNTVPSPKIIDEDLFNQCNELMKTKTTRNIITTYEYLLRDLAYCGCCGKKFYGSYSKSPRGAKVYKCASYIRAKGCGNSSINISLIESTIFNEFLNSKTLLSVLDNPNDIKKQIEKDVKQLEGRLKIETTNKENKQNEVSRLLDLYISNPNMNPELYLTKQADLDKELRQIDDRLTLIKKELFQKKKILVNHNQEKASFEMLEKAKENRHELYAIFKQVIHKVIINKVLKNYTLVTIFIKVDGIVLNKTLKLMINSGAVRNVGHGRGREYKYIPIVDLSNESKYDNNIITEDELKRIETELYQIINFTEVVKHEELDIDDVIDFINVPKENWLMIVESEK